MGHTQQAFRMIIASYGYPSADGIVFTKEAAQAIAEQTPGMVVDNTTGLGPTKKWHILSARVEEHNESQGVVIADCAPAEELDDAK